MAAFAAAISLKNTIDQILHSSRIWLVPPSQEIIELAYEQLQPLQEILERLDGTSKSKSREKVNALDGRIKDAVWEFEDALESLLLDQILSQFETPFRGQLKLRSNMIKGRTRSGREVGSKDEGDKSRLSSTRRRRPREQEEEGEGSSECGRDVVLFSIDLQRLQDDVGSFIHKLKDLEEEYIYELDNMPEDDDDEESTSSTTGFGETKSEMTGLLDQFEASKDYLRRTDDRKDLHVLLGMAGIGKTTLASKIFQDPSITTHFNHRVWVKVGRKTRFDQLSRRVLAQLDPNMHGIAEENDEKIVGGYLKERLEGKKSLIVLDDVWEAEVLGPWISSLPEMRNGTIKILVTARDRMVTSYISGSVCHFSFIVVRYMNEEESKELLCEKVFDEKIFPPHLDKAATKIAKKCEGLPLMILAVAQHLSKGDPAEYWEKVAEMQNSVFTDAYDEISKVLFPTYDYSLNQQYKMFFLYLGVFPPDYDIPTSKLVNMMTAEGWFLDTNKTQSPKVCIMDYSEELGAWKNLLLFNRKSIYWYVKLGINVYKTCRLHSSWRHLCMREASKNKFYRVLIKLADALQQQVMQGQRCLCLQNNILFAIKEFCDSVERYSASSTRSLLFFGPYHQFPIPIDAIGFKLLTKLDALNLRFYAFPAEILTLAQLKYLALACNGELPTTVSKLFNLRVLIIHPHMNIKCCRAPSYIPVQIWEMQDLEHIEIPGKSLLAPPIPNQDVALEKLLALIVGVNAAAISNILELSKRAPSIKKLGVQMELTPYDVNHSSDLILRCFDCTSKVKSLEAFKCSIINPVLVKEYPSSSPRPLMLPRGLKKLHLSGMGFPWECADAIGSLPHLEVLKLRCYAFRGPKWETEDISFPSLQFLVIEDSDLVEWKPRTGGFPKLTYLSMKHCYKLQELGWPSQSRRKKIELVDCNPIAVTCAKQLQPKEFFTSASFLDKQPSPTELRKSFPGFVSTRISD